MGKTTLFFGAVLAATLAQATTIYSNTTTDTLATVFYSASPYTELGDQITFDPGITERRVASASTQFFNFGPAGTFDATLRFFNLGATPPNTAPVGTQIGGDFTVTGLSITDGSINGILTVTFPNLGGLLLPNNVIWTVSVANQTAGVDLGLNFFNPITIGSSPTFDFGPPNGIQRYFVGKIAPDVQRPTGYAFFTTLDPQLDNFYFSVEAVPEPATYAMAAAGLLAIGILRRRK